MGCPAHLCTSRIRGAGSRWMGVRHGEVSRPRRRRRRRRRRCRHMTRPTLPPATPPPPSPPWWPLSQPPPSPEEEEVSMGWSRSHQPAA